MTDIVERLRRGEEESVDGWWSVMDEAAYVIESLRAENDLLLSRIKSSEEAFVRLNDDMGRLKGTLRVNMLRAFPYMSHEEIDAHFVK